MSEESGKLTVRLIPQNGRRFELELDEGATVRDAVQKAGISLKKAEIVKIGGQEVDLDHTLSPHDAIVIATGVSGGLVA